VEAVPVVNRREVPVDPRGRLGCWVSASFLCSLGRLAIGCDRRHGRRRRVGRLVGFDLAHRGSFEFEPVRVVDDTIQDRVTEGRLADYIVPSGDGELAGDQYGATTMAILDDLHEISALAGREAIGAPVIEYEEIDLDQHPEQSREAAVAVGEIEIGEQCSHHGRPSAPVHRITTTCPRRTGR
jgi:hypothetical protein